MTDSEIRYDPARTTADKNKISYTALLSEESDEGSERGISYPVFRSNKNRLYAAKTKPAQEAVFGTLCLAGERNNYGLPKDGMRRGTYGDVVIIFRQKVFKNCMYTAGDRMRGYTNLNAFVFNLFASIKNTNAEDQNYNSELLIPGGSNAYIAPYQLARDLLLLALNQLDRPPHFETLEVQIFDPVELNKNTVSNVYFAGSVKPEQQRAIMNAIWGAPVPAGSPPAFNTKFYVYNNFYTDYHPTKWLYSKNKQNDL